MFNNKQQHKTLKSFDLFIDEWLWDLSNIHSMILVGINIEEHIFNMSQRNQMVYV